MHQAGVAKHRRSSCYFSLLPPLLSDPRSPSSPLRRAESERLSQLRSLQSRRQRGFKLSPAEEVKLAELSAQLGVSDGGSRSSGFKSLAKRRSKEESAGAGNKSEGGRLKGMLRGWGS